MFKLLLCSLLAVGTFAAQAETESDKGITVYTDSQFSDPVYGGSVEIKTEHLSLEDLGNFSLETKDHVHVGADRSLDVRVFVPSTLSKAEVDAFVHTVEDQLKKNRDLERVKVKVIPQSLEEPKDLDQLTGFKKWEEKVKHLTAAILGKTYDPKGVDYAVSFVGGLGRVSIATLLYVKDGGGWNPITMTQASIAATLGIGFSLFATAFSQWKAEYKLPVFKDSSFTKWYNNNPIVKTGTVNEGIGFSYGVTQLFLTSRVQPKTKFTPLAVGEVGLISLLRSPASAAENFAVVQLMSKGHINRSNAQWMAIFYGYLAESTVLLTALDYKRMKYVALATEMGVKLGTYFLSNWKLDAKTNRMFILHPGLDENSRQGIVYVNEFRRVKLTKEMVAAKTKQELQDEVAKGLKDMQGSEEPDQEQDMDQKIAEAQLCLIDPDCEMAVGQN